MRNVWIGGVAALALAWTAGVGAQTTASPGTSANQAGQGTVTVVGCLKPAEAMGGATGTSGSTATGTSSTAGSSDRFMLTNARTGSASSAQTGTSGTTTAGTTTAGTTAGTTSTASRPETASGSMASYTLDGNASELRPHLNHQVEITGRLASAGTAGGSTSTASPTTSTGTATTAGAGQTSAAQTLRVESVRMIAATCPAP
jgi:hypothetical protein